MHRILIAAVQLFMLNVPIILKCIIQKEFFVSLKEKDLKNKFNKINKYSGKWKTRLIQLSL